MKKDKRTIKIVQFPHPVGEHYAPGNSYSEADGSGKIMPWCPVTKAHARKFMKAKGQIVTDGKLSDPTDLLFWGEWEADSRFVELPQDARGGSPRWLHEPFLDREKAGRASVGNAECRVSYGCDGSVAPQHECKGNSGCIGGTCGTDNGDESKDGALQNTDPLVFGDCFLYSLCRQAKPKRKPEPGKAAELYQTQMAKLAPGSIILFGSRLPKAKGGFCFLLDTVFVVGDYQEFKAVNAESLKEFVSHDYLRIMQFQNYSSANVLLTCYKGVTFEQSLDPDYPINGMYSFVPCRPYADDKGFERPRLYARDFAKIENECSMPEPFLNDELFRAPKGTTVTTEQARRLWLCVRDIIREKGYAEGVNLKYETI